MKKASRKATLKMERKAAKGKKASDNVWAELASRLPKDKCAQLIFNPDGRKKHILEVVFGFLILLDIFTTFALYTHPIHTNP
jgi:hypothetical protein